MRDPKRITIILEQIRKIWEQNPDLRLCQLIGNLQLPVDKYYVEDEELTDELEVTYYVPITGHWRKDH